MEHDRTDREGGGSLVDPGYSSGDYFEDSGRHSEDAEFKAGNFVSLFLRFAEQNKLTIQSLVDVGCGSGRVVKIIADTLKSKGYDPLEVKGYDVSPHVRHIENEGVEYIHADFCQADEFVDLVTLFDVFEHVPDPVAFIRLVARRCRIVAFHIPLDNSLNNAVRNNFRSKLKNPGHLIFMDSTDALNLLALAGLRVMDYEYTVGFLAPSGRSSALSKVVLPFRYLLFKISPWLLSKTIGGASLMVIAVTPSGLRDMQSADE
jgi:SAM-dependent methyltransferase